MSHVAHMAIGTLSKGGEYYMLEAPIYGPHHCSMQRQDPHTHRRKTMHVIVPDLRGKD